MFKKKEKTMFMYRNFNKFVVADLSANLGKALLMSFLLCSLLGNLSTESAASGLSIGTSAPDLTLEDVNGKPFVLKEMRGQIIVLNVVPKPKNQNEGKIWMEETRKWMKAIENRYADSIVTLVIYQPFKTGLPFGNLAKYKLKKEPYRNCMDMKGTVVKAYGLTTVQLTLFVLDRSGKISNIVEGKFIEQSKKSIFDSVDLLILKGS